MSRDISDRWPSADDARVIGGPVSELKTDGGTTAADESDLYADGAFTTCPDCDGDLRHQHHEVLVCEGCESQFSHFVTSNGTNKLYSAPANERVATVYDPTDDDGERVLADGGRYRYKIAERVATAAADTVEEELGRRAHDRLDEGGREAVADMVRYATEEAVNSTLKVEAAEKHGHDIVTDGSGAMEPGFHAAAVHIERAGKRVAAGALLPSGAVAVEWNREAFPESERTQHPTTSLYRSIDDAEEASGGSLVVDHAGGPSA